MKLISLSASNFMPYKGSINVDFPTDPDRNVMLVFGDNMRGKTSLLNAVITKDPLAMWNISNVIILFDRKAVYDKRQGFYDNKFCRIDIKLDACILYTRCILRGAVSAVGFQAQVFRAPGRRTFGIPVFFDELHRHAFAYAPVFQLAEGDEGLVIAAAAFHGGLVLFQEGQLAPLQAACATGTHEGSGLRSMQGCTRFLHAPKHANY